MFKPTSNTLVPLKSIDDTNKTFMLPFNLSTCIFVVSNTLIAYCIFNTELVQLVRICQHTIKKKETKKLGFGGQKLK